MIRNLNQHKIIWIITSVLSLFVSLTGVLHQEIYHQVISGLMLPGVISQDLITIIVAISLLILTLHVKVNDYKKQIIILSFLAYLFYGYGIYAIEQVYNQLYLFYLAIFSLSFWSLVFGLVSIELSFIKNISLSLLIRNISVAFSVFIVLLFFSLWTSQLLPLMQTGHKIDFTYSIYILDLTFVLPALIIIITLVLRKISLGLVLMPIIFFKAFTLLFSVGLGGFLKPFYNYPINTGETTFYISLSLLFLALSLTNLSKLKNN